jgi:prepilin-type N-terminal cleavage/methylation domain-containing protein/prepilin-type processing-associated H-X9-DG protein
LKPFAKKEITVTRICKNRQPVVSKVEPSTIVNRKSIESGFTLVELLVVIAVISLLLSVLVPSLSRARSMAKRTVCASNLRQIDLAVRLYLNACDDTYPCILKDPVYVDPNTGDIVWLWMGRGWRSFIEPYLGGNIDVNNPSVLFCPEDPAEPEKYESTSYAYSMAFYHSPEQIGSMDNPGYTCGNGPFEPSIPQHSLDVARPSGKIIMGEWNSNHLRVDEQGWYGFDGWWCWQGSRNYLFVDGHVRYLAAEEIRPANDGWPDVNLTIGGIKGIDWPR